MAASKVCGVCHSTYRGSYAVHASTKRHQQNARRTSDSSKVVRRSARRERVASAARSARRSADHWYSDNLVRVRTYRRSRPNDGTRKVVAVTRHYRARPERWGELVGYLTKSGKVAYRRVRAIAS